jgi:hypothetical protein
MNEKFDNFCKELHTKLDAVDKKDLKAGAKQAPGSRARHS